MAGVPMEILESRIKGKDIKFVRTMPNTPIMVGKGVTGVYLKDQSLKSDVDLLLGSITKIYYMEQEDDLNKVIAISGSSPAYFFAFIESLIKVGVKMGLDPKMANEMSIEAALGAATLASQSNDEISLLRSKVTSKGGATEQALLSLSKNNLDNLVDEAAYSAFGHGQKLDKDFKTYPV